MFDQMKLRKEKLNVEAEPDERFYVYCSWCSVRIREARSEDSEAMCLRCFYRNLNERFRAQPHTRYGEGVSDR
jgi:hypothetical protein